MHSLMAVVTQRPKIFEVVILFPILTIPVEMMDDSCAAIESIFSANLATDATSKTISRKGFPPVATPFLFPVGSPMVFLRNFWMSLEVVSPLLGLTLDLTRLRAVLSLVADVFVWQELSTAPFARNGSCIDWIAIALLPVQLPSSCEPTFSIAKEFWLLSVPTLSLLAASSTNRELVVADWHCMPPSNLGITFVLKVQVIEN